MKGGHAAGVLAAAAPAATRAARAARGLDDDLARAGAGDRARAGRVAGLLRDRTRPRDGREQRGEQGRGQEPGPQHRSRTTVTLTTFHAPLTGSSVAMWR